MAAAAPGSEGHAGPGVRGAGATAQDCCPHCGHKPVPEPLTGEAGDITTEGTMDEGCLACSVWYVLLLGSPSDWGRGPGTLLAPHPQKAPLRPGQNSRRSELLEARARPRAGGSPSPAPPASRGLPACASVSLGESPESVPLLQEARHTTGLMDVETRALNTETRPQQEWSRLGSCV